MYLLVTNYVTLIKQTWSLWIFDFGRGQMDVVKVQGLVTQRYYWKPEVTHSLGPDSQRKLTTIFILSFL